MKKLLVSLLAMLVLLSPLQGYASQLRVFVADMNAIGVPNRDEIKQTLQALLAARLNNDKIISVGGASEADVVVSGTYISIGKVYSLDAIAKTSSGRTITRTQIQGDVKDELITAVGTLSDKLSTDLVKAYASSINSAPALSSKAIPVLTSPKSDFIQRTQVDRSASASEFIKPNEFEQGSTAGWLSKRLEGAFNLMSIGSIMSDGSRMIYLVEERRLALFTQGSSMKLISEAHLGLNEKIISLDTIPGTAGDTIFLSIIRNGEPVSEVWTVKDTKLVKLAGDLPWLFRVIALAGDKPKLYAQAVGRGDYDYYGPVYEAAFTGELITTTKPIEMPRFGNLYTFNQFKDTDGNLFFVVINPDNYLIVYDRKLDEVWRSNDKFSGSELSYQKEDLVNILQNGGNYRTIFMNQHIQVSSKQEVIIGKNEGFWVMGNSRTFKKGAVYNLQWNGSSLEEKWRTRDTQNYMPDFYFDENKNELLILQTVQRSGLSSRGASSLAIKKVE